MKHTDVVRSHKQKVAALNNVSEDLVSKVVRGVRNNEKILSDYLYLVEEEKKAVQRLVTMAAVPSAKREKKIARRKQSA